MSNSSTRNSVPVRCMRPPIDARFETCRIETQRTDRDRLAWPSFTSPRERLSTARMRAKSSFGLNGFGR